ncbi:uncharacterized protein LOC123206034 [Mangifera indica]|uniref:uncharacterized protein LOC123206034 n=1 Tax=Mangifera indica TaxID=29780 RepID=UPI001CFC3AFE|nr:uncharacterized protein LOC123206034 [Mangifera indica]XP_044479060.1 uncharacterized protein LOC123206034 [Mangifera indica]
MQLTAPDSTPLSGKIGVSVEHLASLPSLDVVAEKRIERLAMKVGEKLFNFMQSFCGVDGSKLIVPMDILDRWFNKFQEKAKRDPEYLKGKVVERQENDEFNGSLAEDFEFVSDGRVGSDGREMFVDGQIRQVFPVFNRALLLNEEDGFDYSPRKRQVSLKNLLVEEGREGPPPPPSSSKEEDELEAVPEKIYCVWSPKRNRVAASPNRSNSMGSTSSFGGWFKFPRLLRRSNSEGGHKDSFLFLQKRKTNADSTTRKQLGSKQAKVKGCGDNKVKLSAVHQAKLSPSREVFLMKKSKPIKEVHDKKRSSCKQDLIGFFVNNVSSLGKTIAPF